MPSLETQLGAALQDLKRSLAPDQLDKVLAVIRLCIEADSRHRLTPETPAATPAAPAHV